MLPCLATNNATNRLVGDAELARECHLVHRAGGVQPTNLLHVLGRQSSARDTNMATLANHVLDVCIIRPEEKMGRVHTARIVTPWAIVQHPQPIGNGSMGQLPGIAMGGEKTCVCRESAVSVRPTVTPPQPAIAGLVNAGPESLLWLCMGRIVAVRTGCGAKLTAALLDQVRFSLERIAALLADARHGRMVGHLRTSNTGRGVPCLGSVRRTRRGFVLPILPVVAGQSHVRGVMP